MGWAGRVDVAECGSGGVVAAPPTGFPAAPGAAVVVASMQSNPSGIALAEAAIYGTNRGDGTVRRALKAGGTPVVIATNSTLPFLMTKTPSASATLSLARTT